MLLVSDLQDHNTHLGQILSSQLLFYMEGEVSRKKTNNELITQFAHSSQPLEKPGSQLEPNQDQA